eukprot:3269984-Lingulodinium_polyedra.AAC.1
MQHGPWAEPFRQLVAAIGKAALPARQRRIIQDLFADRPWTGERLCRYGYATDVPPARHRLPQ